MARIKFVDLPGQQPRRRGLPMSAEKLAIIDACKANPGKWTTWPVDAARRVASSINCGHHRALAGFEALSRTDETGVVRCYIRYVGGEA